MITTTITPAVAGEIVTNEIARARPDDPKAFKRRICVRVEPERVWYIVTGILHPREYSCTHLVWACWREQTSNHNKEGKR